MRKLLDEKQIFRKMSNIKSKESNKFFSKADNDSHGGRERSSGNSRNPGISSIQKGRENHGGKHEGSIDTKKAVKQNSNRVDNKAKSQSSLCKMQLNGNFPEYHYYNGIQEQQMFFPSQLFNSGFNVVSGFLPNRFPHLLPESVVPYQQLSRLYFNSYEEQGYASGSAIMNMSSLSNTFANATRSWQFSKLGKQLRKLNWGNQRSITFKVMTYNVLAQDLLVEHQYLYKQNEKKMLGWEIRWRNILNDIKKHNCEIICLQEVQEDHIKEYYNRLGSLGYRGIYKQRTGPRTDGCAIYYKSNMFKLVEYTAVEYRQPSVPILDRDNVGIIATFAPIANSSAEFIVATTHLLYNPRRSDVRLAQVQLLLTELERMAYRHNKPESKYVPVILTGDFNAEPQSPVYNFIVRGKLQYENTMLRANYVAGKALIPPSLMITDNCQHASLLKFRSINRILSRTEEEQHIQIRENEQEQLNQDNSTEYSEYKFNSGTLTHNFVLKSVYNHKVGDDVEGTTYQSRWITVDYIFYSGILDESRNFKDGKLKFLSRYTLPTSNQLSKVRIPNKEEGSDHLALLAFFQLEY